MTPTADTSATAHLDRVRQDHPLIQCLTNPVTVNLVANALLACGATPAMVDIPEEAGLFARGAASAVLVNLGTPQQDQRTAMLEATEPGPDRPRWVLDPVAVGTLPVRTALAQQLLERGPTVIRGNASEIGALAGGAGGRGVDATIGTEEALPAAQELARRTGSVVAVSGATDLVTDGDRVVRVDGGHPLMARITGAGCALGAIVAAFVAGDVDPLEATVAACCTYAVAGELAAERAARPGSYAVALIDALDAIDADILAARGRVS